jgi:peptidoglycan/xylan/chitin deacetylase (PgdA/CDA1 family)
LSREEIKLMLDSGLVAIGSHSSNHLYMDNLEYDELEIEIAGSKEAIENIFDTDVKSFAYPWGRSSTACQNVCKRAGYSMAFTTRAGRNYRDIDPYSLKRRDAGYLAENLIYSKNKALVVMRGLMDFLPR